MLKNGVSIKYVGRILHRPDSRVGKTAQKVKCAASIRSGRESAGAEGGRASARTAGGWEGGGWRPGVKVC